MVARRIPSLSWLRVFEAAARLESFAGAAAELGMSAPAVSQQVRALEGHFGRALFARGARHVRLTQAGAAFLPAVRQALAGVETTAAALFGERDVEPLMVRATTLLAESWLASRLGGFQALHPSVHLVLMTGNGPEDMQRSHADVLIDFGSAADFPDHAEPVLDERLYPVARRDIAATIAAPDDLLKHRLIEIATHRSGWAQVLGAPGKCRAGRSPSSMPHRWRSPWRRPATASRLPGHPPATGWSRPTGWNPASATSR
jgi:LysR family glycine cleavage system transcriptional activator